MVECQLLFRHDSLRFLSVITIVLLSACSSIKTEKQIRSDVHVLCKKDTSLSSISQKKQKEITYNSNVKSRIMDQYFSWKGVQYRFGGNTKNGIDCSAFVQRTFHEKFGLELPRSTYMQKKVGKSIPHANLRAGDLVIFRGKSNGRHIGIYIENGRFIHVSTRNGVMISNLNKPYWKSHFSDARRVLSSNVIKP